MLCDDPVLTLATRAESSTIQLRGTAILEALGSFQACSEEGVRLIVCSNVVLFGGVRRCNVTPGSGADEVASCSKYDA